MFQKEVLSTLNIEELSKQKIRFLHRNEGINLRSFIDFLQK